jgi:hypothetical protein
LDPIYQGLAPQNLYAEYVCVTEAILGTFYLAFISGIVMAKCFASNCSARVVFSEVAVVETIQREGRTAAAGRGGGLSFSGGGLEDFSDDDDDDQQPENQPTTPNDMHPIAPQRRPFRPHFTYLYRLVLTRSRCP